MTSDSPTSHANPSGATLVTDILWGIPLLALVAVAFQALLKTGDAEFALLFIFTTIAGLRITYGPARSKTERYMLRFNVLIVMYLLVGFLRAPPW